MFVVTDNGKPCDCFNHNVDKSWSTSKYNTFEEALTYAHKWLGDYSPGLDFLRSNLPYNYAGMDDSVINIKKLVYQED